MLRKQRLIVASAITAFWLVMVALFLARQGWFAAPPDPPPAARADLPREQWMGIFLEDGKRVGYLHLRTDPAARDGVPGQDLALDARLETRLFGMSAGMAISGEAWTAENGETANFSFALTSGDHKMGAEGALSGGRLIATLQTGGQAIPLVFPVQSPLLPASAMGLTPAGMPDLEPGESVTIPAFDPLAMKMGEARIECVGNELIAAAGVEYGTRVYATTIGGLTSKAWVATGGEVIQATTPFGFTLRKIAPETLAEATPEADQGDIIQSLAIFPTGETVWIDATRLRVRITGIDPEKLPHDPPWQVREGDVLEIRQPAPLPAPGDRPAGPEFDTVPYLESDPFIAADHPEIIERAHAIAGDETDPWARAVRLHEWMYEEIEKIPVLSVPNALDVLRTGQGDCNEHAVLYAALARALGIPCRIAIGLVYSDMLGGFGYHAWPEVYHGEWYPIDPTLGQLAADATHIKLFNGGLDAWMQLAGYIGQMEIEVLEVE
ncbi:MAG: transglutaminase domain-containing protein [Candidatus Hydrogenedentes bacterium]|nr:transglutaminase domain-containing protein [Candidatus Hydrogenedentota bacterium]